jgi:hypothetical protein
MNDGQAKTSEIATSPGKTPVEGALPEDRWDAMIKVTNSPLKLFALIVLVCNSVFGIAAAWSFNEQVFIYTLHTFLAVVASFALIALWSPRSFYSPAELIALAKLDAHYGPGNSVLPQAKPIVPTVFASLFILVYAVYQALY